MNDVSAPNLYLLYLVAVFAIEPVHETRLLDGSLGEVASDGELHWHVVYRRVEEHQGRNVPRQENIDRAFNLLHRLLAPKEWASQTALDVRLIRVGMYRGSGEALAA